MLKKLLVIPAIALLLSVGAPAHAQGTCGEVCTPEFWDTATQAEIEAALRDVDANVSGEAGLTPLHRAAAHGTPENIELLLEAGAAVNARNEYGETPLQWAAAAGRGNIITLLKAGANVNVRNENGFTPLHMAARFGTPENIVTLLEAGADVNARAENGSTPLHRAAWSGAPENVLALLEAGADGTAEDEDGQTPFYIARENEDLRGTDAYWALNDARFR